MTDKSNMHLGGNISYGDPATFAPTVWNYVIDRFCIKSVLDLGSGLGFASDYFFKKGLKVVAIEGMTENVEKSLYPAIQHDLTKGPIYSKVDLVHCQEVVEHIEEKYLDNLLTTMSCGKYLLMTNALPGQGGHHHVNEQPTEYWIKHLTDRGLLLLVEDSNRVRKMAGEDGAVFLAATALVFANPKNI